MPERALLPASVREEMPSPSAELTLIGVLMRAHMKTLPRKKRREFVANLIETLDEFEACANVVRLRGREHDAALRATHRQARAWVTGMTSAFWAADHIDPQE